MDWTHAQNLVVECFQGGVCRTPPRTLLIYKPLAPHLWDLQHLTWWLAVASAAASSHRLRARASSSRRPSASTLESDTVLAATATASRMLAMCSSSSARSLAAAAFTWQKSQSHPACTDRVVTAVACGLGNQGVGIVHCARVSSSCSLILPRTSGPDRNYENSRMARVRVYLPWYHIYKRLYPGDLVPVLHIPRGCLFKQRTQVCALLSGECYAGLLPRVGLQTFSAAPT